MKYTTIDEHNSTRPETLDAIATEITKQLSAAELNFYEAELVLEAVQTKMCLAKFVTD